MRPVPEARGSEPQGFGASWTFAFDKLHEMDRSDSLLKSSLGS